MAKIILCVVQLIVLNVLKTLTMFCGKYNPLYNNVSDDKDEINDIKCEIEDDFLKRVHNDNVFVTDVTKAVRHVKEGKTDENEGPMSDNIHGTHSLYVQITIVLMLCLFMVYAKIL